MPLRESALQALERFRRRTRIAFFSMEIALHPDIHTSSGGLGVLAGDMARSSADLALPVVFVTLISRAGYVRQTIDAEGRQHADENPWRPEEWCEPLGAMVAIELGGRNVWIRPWLYLLNCPLGYCVPVLLLDTNLHQNAPADRAITDRLYGGDDAYRLKQEAVLGIGGATILRALGFAIDTYHLNEGHAALLTLQLLREYRREPDPLQAGNPLYEREHVRDRCVFTTHTPVDAAFDKFPYDLVRDILGDYIEISELKLLAGDSQLNMTQLALNLSGFVNGVSRQHAETTTQLFPGYRVHSITNGVHPPTWTHASFARLYDADFPQWAHEPEVLKDADQLRDADIWSAHQEAKRSLADYIRAQAGFSLRDDVALIGFARRMTGYKRPDLLFDDIAALSKVARERPFQVVFAGIAHPRDVHGTQLIAQINQQIRNLKPVVPMAFLPNYDMRVGALLTAGADVWLNTPLPPLEASGTSGMKAALNGVLNLSVLDGWWVEAHIEGVTGWAIGNGKNSSGHQDAAELYAKLSRTILPLYYDDRDRWIWMMKQSISKVGAYFTTQRVMRRYATEAYLR